MTRCDRCGEVETLPYNCRYCGGQFCSAHRLPENHDCPGLDDIGQGVGVFDSGFDDSLDDRSSRGSVVDKLNAGGVRRSLTGYIRGNVTFVFLAAMWITFIAQQLVLVVGGSGLHQTLFVLSAQHPERVWTWITSIFAHGGLIHIAFNSIVIFFFGPLVERYIGSRRFAALFIVSGILAGLSQIAFGIVASPVAPSTAVLGASGAALAILGVLTVFNPNLRVYLYAIIPMPIWVLTLGIAVISIGLIAIGAPSAFGIAHVAHLVGLLVGVAYGAYLLRTMTIRPPSSLRLGAGPPGPGREPPKRRL